MAAIDTPSAWVRLMAGVAAIFVLFQLLGSALGSDRGQAGILIGFIIVAATIVAERSLFGTPLSAAPLRLGLGAPAAAGAVAALAISAAVLATLPAFATATGASLTLRTDAAALLPGLFMQGGVGEEILFRGFLFGHVRRGRTFGRAAILSMLPFVAVHLWLFLTMPWPVALAAVLVSALLAFPFARLYEIGGGTIWAPAILHCVIQGAIKVVDVVDPRGIFPFVWMAASTFVPMLVFLWPRHTRD
jgi:membrane protease YdiL (CAAX protease family)